MAIQIVSALCLKTVIAVKIEPGRFSRVAPFIHLRHSDELPLSLFLVQAFVRVRVDVINSAPRSHYVSHLLEKNAVIPFHLLRDGTNWVIAIKW